MSLPKSLNIKIGMRLDEVEKLVILRTLQSVSGDKSMAAKILGISVKTLQRKLREYLAYRLDSHVLEE